MKSKLNVKSEYSIKKVNKVLRMKTEKFVPHTYELYKVSGPNKFVKFFVTRCIIRDFRILIKFVCFVVIHILYNFRY